MNEPTDKPHSSDLRKGRISLAGCAYFITKCVRDTVSRPLAGEDCALRLVSSLIWARDHRWLRILGFVVMPDHYHALIAVRTARRLADVMASMDKFTARQINDLLGRRGSFWQDGFYEHMLRDRADYDAILAYVHNNPVEAGLAAAADVWQYSTANPRYAHEIDREWLGPSLPKSRVCKHRFSADMVPMRFR